MDSVGKLVGNSVCKICHKEHWRDEHYIKNKITQNNVSANGTEIREWRIGLKMTCN